VDRLLEICGRARLDLGLRQVDDQFGGARVRQFGEGIDDVGLGLVVKVLADEWRWVE
jgi:hypothetical protein